MSDKYNMNIIDIKYYKEAYMVSLGDPQIIDYAEKLLEGIVSIGYKNDEIIRYNPHNVIKFNWDVRARKNSNTFSLYLLGLRHAYILTKAYEFSNKKYYISLADEFINAFYEYYYHTNPLNGMANNDHAISERIENLVYLYSIAEKNNYKLNSEKKLIKLLEDDIKKLLGAKYYQRNHNHGIIVDKAALIGVYFLNKNNMQENLVFIMERLKKQVDYGYTIDGIHKENSFDYHISITAYLIGCSEIIKLIGNNYYIELSKILQKANEYIIYALKPDKERPLFGDSKGTGILLLNKDGTYKRRAISIEMFNDNEELYYINSQGKEGKKPSKLSAYFSSGYIFFREHFNEIDYENATWLSFKAGYKTRVHKHQDDLSITLYSRGYDIFVDSGMCGYMPKDQYKDYMESIPAHTTIGIKNRPYSIANGNGEKFKIQKYIKKDYYEYAMASSRVYDDAAIYRHIYYFKERNLIFIRDELYSDKNQSYAQYFNLSNYVDIIKLSQERVEMRIGDTEYNVVIRQLKNVSQLNLLEGERTIPMSLNSTGFGTFENSKTLEYICDAKDAEFYTVIEIKNKNEVDSDIIVLPDHIVIQPNNLIIPIEKTNIIQYDGVNILIDNDNILVQNIGIGGKNKFALYVYDKEKNEAIIKIPYTEDEWFKLENIYNDTILLYYVSSYTGELIKGIIADIQYTKEGMIIRKQYDTLHRPILKKQKINKINESTYQFIVDLQYDYIANCSWWVYYNGANIFFEQNHNYNFKYEFIESGEYVVMYSFRDKYFGEFVFNQFDKIII